MRLVAYCAVLLCYFARATMAQYPMVTANVDQSVAVTLYTYQVTNVLAEDLTGFYLYLPATSLPLIRNVTGPSSQWYVTFNTRLGLAEIRWSLMQFGNDSIRPGQSATFNFAVPVGVPTGYYRLPWETTTNWQWYGTSQHPGNTLLPVPVPEPSPVLALGVGGIGILGVALRRRVRGRA